MTAIQDNRAIVQKVLWITLLLNLFVMGLKGAVGLAINSLSLQADALHSVTDSANNVLGLVAMRFSSPRPDRDHPYGHLKYEAVGALAIAAFLGIACFEILKGAIDRLMKGGKPVEIGGPELWLLVIVLGVNIFVAYYERSVGKRVGSPILVADARHTLSDVWVTVAVLGGLIGVWQGNIWHIPQLQSLDVFLSFPVAFMVFKSGLEVIKENLPYLVDEMAIAPEIIHDIVMEVPGVLNCHAIASRGIVGRQVFMEMHLIVDAPDVATAHHITESVEERLTERFSPVRVVIHVEPPDYETESISFEEE
ncbi:cation diffusion facilitator family transporter [Pannus brasiliensis CCIBt3594]|uniref:Cation diffusion facilitator family transporter n=1 Tax=Pannus brasiliensis CCIBt3594 TaxID=1427578 RepID=A0AAW9QX21_9CHRO